MTLDRVDPMADELRETTGREIEAARTGLLDERARTLERIGQLEDTVGAIVESGDLDPPDDEHDPEGHTIGFERAFALSLLGQARSRLEDLGHALRRLDADDYGTCERCGRPIEPERLVARPDATTCIACAGLSLWHRG